MHFKKLYSRIVHLALTSVAQLVGCLPLEQKVASSCSRSGHMPESRVPSLSLGAYKKQLMMLLSHINVLSLYFSFPSTLSLKDPIYLIC